MAAKSGKEQPKKKKPLPKKSQGDLVFALDIGTRSIIGMVGKVEGERFHVLGIQQQEHTQRSMKDGQIEDIDQVALVARSVKKRLEDSLGISLKKVCIAAAGRALRTQKASYEIDLEQTQTIDGELIARLEMGAVTAAEEAFNRENMKTMDSTETMENTENIDNRYGDEKPDSVFFLAGYSVLAYYLDDFNISSLKDHRGKKLKTEVIATFLPSEVVDSLYATMQKCKLEVVSLTLEPIAAINAAIPKDLRLLNLALVDIGAGTSDIALCREGGITGYTMATLAGDEITEALMKQYLVDFQTAEGMKMGFGQQEEITYTNILGMEEKVTKEEILQVLKEPIQNLTGEIIKRIEEINGGPPSAIFLAGGGSKLVGLKEAIAEDFHMDQKRVAIAGANFQRSAFSTKYDLNNPEYATPLGIAVSSGLHLLHGGVQILLNGKPAKVFKSGDLRIIDVLMMNGYGYSHILGRSGRTVSVTLEGKKKTFYGERAAPAVLKLNGAGASISDQVRPGDRVDFTPAVSGRNAEPIAGDILPEDFEKEEWEVWVNDQKVQLQSVLKNGDEISLMKRQKIDDVSMDDNLAG